MKKYITGIVTPSINVVNNQIDIQDTQVMVEIAPNPGNSQQQLFQGRNFARGNPNQYAIPRRKKNEKNPPSEYGQTTCESICY